MTGTFQEATCTRITTKDETLPAIVCNQRKWAVFAQHIISRICMATTSRSCRGYLNARMPQVRASGLASLASLIISPSRDALIGLAPVKRKPAQYHNSTSSGTFAYQHSFSNDNEFLYLTNYQRHRVSIPGCRPLSQSYVTPTLVIREPGQTLA